MFAGPVDVGFFAELEQEFELFGEERVVVFEAQAEERKGFGEEPRPATISARPPEIRSSVANSWKTRTGSAAESTVTALVRRMLLVRAAAAERMTTGAESRNSGAVVFADAEDVEARLRRRTRFRR